MLKLSSVYFSYNEKKIIKDYSLTVNDGECVALKGDSGSGKTTVALILLGLRKPDSGTVDAPEKISVVFQEDRFVENLSLIKNIRMAIPKEKYEFADLLLEKVGLSEFKSKKIYELSGGMKRRAAIVRAIAFGGDALILDEAFNGIDDNNKEICASLIKQYFTESGKPILFITHIDSDAKLLNSRTEYIERNR